MKDPVEQLRGIVKGTGEIASVYGGFEVKVLKPKSFPWHQAINQLIKIGQKVWVEKREENIYIISEPNIQ